MKKAIGYIRISDKDQSNFSLSGQESYIRDYCVKNDIELLACFTDDGKSAKNFDRPDWQLLERFVKDNYKDVDYLIVCKYDRFSRNVAHALEKIQRLENQYRIRIMSVMEPIAMHPDSPYFFQVRTQMLLGAQVEWMVIRDRTRFGIHNANKNGRYVNRAPVGYKMERDASNKPILVIEPLKARLIRRVFELFLSGHPIEAIRREMRKAGLILTGSSTIQGILSNPVYAGLIRVKAYYDEPERLQKGIHEGLVSESDWWKAKALLSENKGRSHMVQNENVFLRGSVRCFCSKLLTAGNSRSKSGKYYWYYHCPEHRAFNLRATKLHDDMMAIMQELHLTPMRIKYMEDKAVSRIMETMKTQYDELKASEQRIRTLGVKLDSLEEQLIDKTIDKEVYQKWRSKYITEMELIRKGIDDLRNPLEKRIERVQQELRNLESLAPLFEKASITQKAGMVNWVFDSSIYFRDGIYRTPFIQPIYSSKAALLKEKGLLVIEQPPVEKDVFLKKYPAGELNRTLQPFLALLQQIKAA